MIRAAALGAAALLLAPAAAAARDPAPAPVPAPAAAGTLAVQADGPVFRVKQARLVLRGSRIGLRGALAPALAGQAIEVRVLRDGKRRRTLRAVTAADGTFAVAVKLRRAGRYSLRTVHAASPEIAETRGPRVVVFSKRAHLSAGARGALVRLYQRRLAALRYFVPRTGVFDAGTARATMAFRKVQGWTRGYDANALVIRRVLRGVGAFKPRHPKAGRHVEADLSRQVLALIDRGKVVATYHTSTGAPATPTILGTYRVYRKSPGTNAAGMVHSSYFIRGYAIHGYVSVPAFNASHGCLRVPLADAMRIYNWIRMGDRVIVYP